jgi:hypothetical protein
MRWAALVLFSAVLLLGLAAAPGVYAQGIDPNDNFDDGVLSPNWIPWPLHANRPVETGGKVVLTVPPDTTSEWAVDSNLYSSWVIRGLLDVQVDYQLLDWPAHSSAMVGITLSFPGESDSTMRASGRGQADDGTDETYTFNYRDDYCSCDGQIATTDTVGKLRVTRDADSILTSYYWSAAANDWVVLNTRPIPADDAHVTLLLWGVVPEPGMSVAFDNFQVNSGEVIPFAPTIENVVIDRGRNTDRWDWQPWHQRITVQVRGTEYEQPACVLITDPQDNRYVIPTCGIGGWYDPLVTNPGGSSDVRVTGSPDDTYAYTWYEARKEYVIPEGSYQITAVCDAGSWPTVDTLVLPAASEEGPVPLAPASDGVIDATTPTFAWTPLSGSEQTLQVRAEGATNYSGPLPEQDDCGEIWRADVGEQASAVYNFDGTGPELEPGRTYFWQVSAWRPVDDRVTDSRVSVWDEQTARDRFTIDTTWPALPDLPGRLAYEQTMYGDSSIPYDLEAILQYGTTPAQRKWIGPVASHTPSYSWDGAKLAYRISDFAIRVANADGSDPVRLPAMWDWYGAEFSPDATWVTYADGEWQGSEPQHIFIQKLFEPERTLLVLARGFAAWDPHWSPDGVWISYLSCCESSGNYMWLVHPDGTDDHPVLPTGMVGYPGATVTWFAGTPAWSPDAMRLGVGFNFTTTEGETFTGIGTISRNGGDITPLWINPPGVVCCAGAKLQTWSPDGNSVVFSSAHHLTPDPDWSSGKFEPGVELWLISADGTGEPIRLTYDYSEHPSAAWWAPNTPVGKGVSVMKGAATLTFAQVTAEGSTRMHVTADVPGAAPEGYAFAGDLWSGATTAGYHGDITVALPYDAGLAGQEDSLALMEWNPEKAKWQDITVRPIDVTNHVIRGRTKDLGVFAVCVRTR